MNLYHTHLQAKSLKINLSTNYEKFVIIKKAIKNYKSISMSYNLDFFKGIVDISIEFWHHPDSKKEAKLFSKKFNINVDTLL